MNGYGKSGIEKWYTTALDAFRRELAAQAMIVRARRTGAWFVFGCPIGDGQATDVNVRMHGIKPEQLRALTIVLTASCAKNGIVSEQTGEIIAGLFTVEQEAQASSGVAPTNLLEGPTPVEQDTMQDAPAAAPAAGRRDRLLDVPERYREGLERYVRDHVEPGSFLRCVLEDRLLESVMRMDRDLGLDDLRALVSFVHNEVMWGENHGDAIAVRDWLDAPSGKRGECAHCKHPGKDQWYESQPLAPRA